MEEKKINILIKLILLIIIILGGMYIYKMSGREAEDFADIGNKIQQTISTQLKQDPEKETQNTIITKPPNITPITVHETPQNIQGEQIIIPTVGTKEPEENPNQTPINTTGYIYNNRYYYNKLDSYSKILYEIIEENIEKLKYGDQVININQDFSELLKQENGQEILNKYYDDAINAINLDIPHLFYIDFSKMYLNVETTTSLFSTKYRLYFDKGRNPNYYSTGFTTKEQIENINKQIEDIKAEILKKSGPDNYSKIKNMHDWIIENLEYDGARETRGTIYGALIEKRAVCEGYARTYKYLLDELGINNILVTGRATNSKGITEEHMWNYIKINDSWYAVDTTWDDPIIYGGGKISDKVKHKYFLIGSNELYRTHEEKNTISASGKIFELPKLNQNNY